MKNIQAVIFDLDDTLYPEKSYALSGYRAVAELFESVLGDAVVTYKRMCALFDSPHRARVFNVILEEAGIDNTDDLVRKMVTACRTHAPQINLHDDANEALSLLRPQFKLGVISDGFLDAQQRKIEALQIETRVDTVILTDTWGREYWKPHPRAFEEISRTLQVAHSACVYIGDNRAKDFIAPNLLGWSTIYIDRPDGVHRSKPAPPGGEPQHVVHSLHGLDTLLS
ncbi:MAG: HAD family hydrolase [Planctomycetes bacterium]|nr:HAD family hydrolase [Planctomycetota bacterium]